MNLYIFTGPPASGKSTLAAEISNDLKINVYSKDDIKVRLFKKIGFTSHEEKKKNSRQSELVLFERIKKALAKKRDVIVDNNYKNFDTIRELKKTFSDLCVYCIYLTADYKILADRYNKRIADGTREKSLFTLNVYPIISGVSKFHDPIDEKVVEDIEKQTTEKVYGDYIRTFDTTCIDKDFRQIKQNVLDFIRGNNYE